MGLPIVAIIGRPNVGKSTLVNRLAGEQTAIVHDEPGVTRDRTYLPAYWSDREFQVVDTGGLVFNDDTEFLPLIRQQALAALHEASAAIFVVNGQTGPNSADEEIAEWLRQQPVPVFLAVNKCESPDQGSIQASEFWELGLGEPYPISAIHGNGTGELLDELIKHLPPTTELEENNEIKIAIIGRPNVGKSSLLNAFAGEERVIVSPISGTTRDAIDTFIERNGQNYRLIDTAGIRKKKSIDYGTEFFSINRAFKAIRRADVVLLVIDALDGVTEQDQKLAGRILDEGKACVVVVNKWDAVEKDSYTIYDYEKNLEARLHFTEWADTIYVSAVTGQRVEKILELVTKANEEHKRRVSTSVINEVLEDAVSWHSPPTSRGGRQGRIYYGTQVSTQPPTIALFVNEAKRFNDNYRRYIERQFRQQLGFKGTPIRLLWRSKKVRDVESGSANRATRV
ncbi:Small GTP-binding protein domain protein [Trichormus variabilis ATCC 29413]|uniref:GTPase Der n=2 Tax=Anabaena variabilis TaxID=264691 RepID=DER_TRIV2|nr:MULTISPECIES: ribosome biogenesis GTPase Der [Nostocaceae]Q3M929.1 RecName: Full=GTPase Der; AltName: Full=GTP-binding protein EngA [Trichormus variabilis ATCC 29413]ABA22507.1 Small GTP-binding protein domain protein [Trichormus variabilis ATCC 29413]MBC1213022.1 ribosome biogenesis GTPase Der [Trichormus variabilis ARAD]MBC1255283.1 ribosome biogenesis GTPase Der [Trichormus variabilis V5]MBC1267552.1 ribosome biogenesis GTPase Der [Trichormus variabilis FSR]MBC1301008.1 ribosome biogene